MTPVKNALASARSKVSAMMDWDGPSWSDPVRLKVHMNDGRTTNARKSAYPTQVNSTQRAVMPELALTSATQRASSIQPIT